MTENSVVENGLQICQFSSTGFGTWVPEFIKENSNLVSPSIILFSISVAYLGIITQRSIARKRATLDLIEKYESTEYYQKLNEAFSDRRKNNDWKTFVDPEDNTQRENRHKLVSYLNHYELVAIGIKNKSLDGATYKNWMRTAYIRDWDAAAGFVNRNRWRKSNGSWEYNSKIYENYHALAIKWGAQHKINKGNPPNE